MPLNHFLEIDEHHEHFLAILLGSSSSEIDPDWLQQMVREVAIGVCIDRTLPEVSLETGSEGVNAIIPVAYRYGHVGELLTQLAYVTQNYIYGGVMQDSQESDPISFGRYFFYNHPDQIYHPFARWLASKNLMPDVSETPTAETLYHLRFSSMQIKFKFYFHQKKAELSDNTLIFNPTFNLTYELIPSVFWKNYFDEYKRNHGHLPEDYQDLEKICLRMCRQAEVQLPLVVGDLIGKLKIVQTLVTYFSHLQARNKIPKLTPLLARFSPSFSRTLPYLYQRSSVMILTSDTVIEKIDKELLLEWRNGLIENNAFELIIYETIQSLLTPKQGQRHEDLLYAVQRVKSDLDQNIKFQHQTPVFYDDECVKIDRSHIANHCVTTQSLCETSMMTSHHQKVLLSEDILSEYFTFHIDVEREYALYPEQYDALRGSLLTPACSHLFSKEDLNELNAFIQGTSLSLNIDPRKKNHEEQTILHYALRFHAKPNLIENILRDWPELLTQVDKFGFTPLHFAAYQGDLDVLKIVFSALSTTALEEKTKEHFTPLMLAAQQGHKDIVEYLLSVGASPHVSLLNGETALCLAILHQHKDTALLLMNHSDIDCHTIDDNTPLFMALTTKQDEIAKQLIEKGANITHTRKSDYMTGLCIIVIQKGSTELLQLFMEKLAEQRDAQICHLRHQIQQAQTQIAQLKAQQEKRKSNAWMDVAGGLLSAVCWTASSGFTATFSVMPSVLARAASQINQAGKSSDATRSIRQCHDYITECNAVLRMIDRPITYHEKSQSLIHVAILMHAHELARQLIAFEKGNIDVPDREGNTPLMLAILEGDQTFGLELAQVAAVNARNHKKETASLLAMQRGLGDIADCLMKRGEEPRLLSRKEDNVLRHIRQHQMIYRYRELAPRDQHTLLKMEGGYVPPLLDSFKNSAKPTLAHLKFLLKFDDIGYLRQLLETVPASVEMALQAIQAESQDCLQCLLPLLSMGDCKSLMQAALKKRHIGMIKSVLPYLEDRNQPLTEQGETIAQLIIQYGLSKLIKAFVKVGIDFGDRVLFEIAIRGDDLLSFQILFALEARNLNMLDLFKLSVFYKSPRCQKELLKKYRSWDSMDQNEAFEWVCLHKDAVLMNQLLDYKILSEVVKAEQLRLFCVRSLPTHERQNFLKILLKHGADPILQLNEPCALQEAIERRQIATLYTFARAGFGQEMATWIETTRDPYTKEALMNQRAHLNAAIQELIAAHKKRDASLVNSILAEGFPFNEVYLGEYERPFLQLLFSLQGDSAVEQAYISSIFTARAETNQPFQALFYGEDGYTLSTLLNPAKFAWLNVYFEAEKAAILMQKVWNPPMHLFAGLSKDSRLFFIEHGYPLKDAEGQSLLFTAVELNDLTLIEALLQRQENINETDRYARTPLSWAAELGFIHLVQTLIEHHHADANARDLNQYTALHHAISKGHDEIALYLIQHTQSLNAEVRDGNTAFMMASAFGLLTVCQALEKHVLDFNQCNDAGLTSLDLAVGGFLPAMIHYLMSKGMKITSIHHCQDASVLNCLLGYGADLFLKNHQGETALECLIRSRDPLMMLMLKQQALSQSMKEALFLSAAYAGNVVWVREWLNELNMNCINVEGQNALHMAIRGQQREVALYLISHGILVEHLDHQGNSPLHWAAKKNATYLFRMLIGQVSLDPNGQDKDGKTALYRACEEGHIASVVDLQLLGADFSIAANNGLTPAQIAFNKGFIRIAKLLFICEDNSLFEDSFYGSLDEPAMLIVDELRQLAEDIETMGATVLHKAVYLGHEEAIRLICDILPDLKDYADLNEKTPVMLADDLGFTNIKALLISYTGRDLTAMIPPASRVEQEARHVEQEARHVEHCETPPGGSEVPHFVRDDGIFVRDDGIFVRDDGIFVRDDGIFVHTHPEIMEVLQSSQHLKVPHRWILMRCLLDRCEAGWSAAQVLSLRRLAEEIIKTLGERAFCFLFDQNSEPLPINQYIETAEKLLLLIHNKKISLYPLKGIAEIDYHYDILLSEKQLDTHLESLRLKFTTLFSSTELEAYLNAYQNIIEYGQLYRKKSTAELRDLAKEIALNFSSDPQGKENLLAILRLLMFKKGHIYPYDTQMMAIMILLDYPRDLNGRVGQILTGQGKTTLIAMIAAFYGLLGLKVHVVTSTIHYAQRDEREQRLFLEAAGLTSEAPFSLQSLYDQTAAVIYSTIFEFEGAILSDLQEGKTEEGAHAADVVICDEADYLGIDSIDTHVRQTQPSVFDVRWIYRPIYSWIVENIELRDILLSDVTDCRLMLEAYQEGRHQAQVSLFLDKDIHTWIQSALLAYDAEKQVHYVVNPNIIIVDHELTGRCCDAMRWGDGLHEFLEVKEKMDPEFESLSTASISHVSFFKRYKIICALTGTLGALIERREMCSRYNIDARSVPPHQAVQREEYPAQYYVTGEDHQDAVLRSILTCISAKRPVLVLCSTIARSEQWMQFLHQQGIAPLCLNDIQLMDEEYIVKELAGKPSSVLVATLAAGRGMNIVLDERCKALGMHIVIEFLPKNQRVEDQIKGRVARNNDPGSCELILWSGDPGVAELLSLEELDADALGFLTVQSLKERRELKNEEDCGWRQKLSEKETFLYQLVKSFYETEFPMIRTAIKEVPHHLELFSAPQVTEVLPEMRYNRLIQPVYRSWSVLLRAQMSGMLIDWVSHIQWAKHVYLDYLKQHWAVLYAKFSNMHVSNFRVFQTAYDLFLEEMIRPIQHNTESEFDKFVQQLLTLAQTDDHPILDC